ncbi:MAG: oxygen-independent coproporphyrinogen III oxidase [Alphaproteobacteria bacterium]|nr:oxygen-independent coproporphyrinogen III oxidase [Alphaproteobacteria bacterium]
MDTTLVEKYSRPTPRYTSYPTAPHFHNAITGEHYRDWLTSLSPGDTISLYTHIPYCDRLCWFCGCATKQTNRYHPVERYLTALKQEIASVGELVDAGCPVTAVHFGGGSPTMLEPADMIDLGRTLRQHFNVTPDAEISVEMDPNDLTEAKYDALAAIGVTRASLGVQDFDIRVQRAINREQSFEQTRAVVEAMRKRNVRSVNLDMLYGLPHQNLETIKDTADQVLSLQPDRIALFGYAHVPWMKKHQQMIDEAKLPGSLERYEQANLAAALFQAHGYQRIGIDHFARSDDTLAGAHQDGTLHRNFQGYTDDDAKALIGLGASSIGKLPQGYVQNSVPTADYQRRVESGLATVRGLTFSQEDRMRGWLIERLMCDFAFSSQQLIDRFGSSADPLLREAKSLLADDTDGLVEETDGHYRLTETGRPFVRSIAAKFDPYFSKGIARHSVSV